MILIIVFSAIAAYIAIGVLTWFWVKIMAYRNKWDNEDRVVIPAVSGLFWPLAWVIFGIAIPIQMSGGFFTRLDNKARKIGLGR